MWKAYFSQVDSDIAGFQVPVRSTNLKRDSCWHWDPALGWRSAARHARSGGDDWLWQAWEYLKSSTIMYLFWAGCLPSSHRGFWRLTRWGTQSEIFSDPKPTTVFKNIKRRRFMKKQFEKVARTLAAAPAYLLLTACKPAKDRDSLKNAAARTV